MSNPPIVTPFSQFAPLIIQKYESYLPSAFDENLSLLQKLNKIINSLNTIGTNFNSIVDQWNEAITWVEGDGLTQAVDDLLNQWKTDGTLDSIIEGTVFQDFTTRLTNIESMGLSILTYPTQTGETDDTPRILRAISDAQTKMVPLYFPPNAIYNLSNTIQFDMTKTRLIGFNTIFQFTLSSGLHGVELNASNDATNYGWKSGASKPIEGIIIRGTGSRVTGTVGLKLGTSDSFNARFSLPLGVNISNFDKGIEWGYHSYANTFEGVNIDNCNICVNFDNTLVGTDRAERWTFKNCNFYNALIGINGGSIGDVYFEGGSMDYLDQYAITSGSFIFIDNAHIEGIDHTQINHMFDSTSPDYGGIIVSNSTIALAAKTKLSMPIAHNIANNRIGVKFVNCILIFPVGSTFAVGFENTYKHRYLGNSDSGSRVVFEKCRSNKTGIEFYLLSEYHNKISSPDFTNALGLACDFPNVTGVTIDNADGPFSGEYSATLTNAGALMETDFIPITDDSMIKIAMWSKLVSYTSPGASQVLAEFYSSNKQLLGTSSMMLNQNGAYDVIGNWIYKPLYAIQDGAFSYKRKAFMKLKISVSGVITQKVGRLYLSVD